MSNREAANQTRIQELLQQEKMLQHRAAVAYSGGDFAEVTKINKSLDALELVWKSMP